MNEESTYLEREITVEFSFGAHELNTVRIRRDIESGALVDMIQEASRIFIAGCRSINMVEVAEEVADVHLTLRYFHMDNSDEMIMLDLKTSACEILGSKEVAGAVEILANRVVPSFLNMLLLQGIELPN